MSIHIPTIFLSRRNLLTLLSKLDRHARGEDTACSIIKHRVETDDFVQTDDAVLVTAIEDSAYYRNRIPGQMFDADEQQIKAKV